MSRRTPFEAFEGERSNMCWESWKIEVEEKGTKRSAVHVFMIYTNDLASTAAETKARDECRAVHKV